MLLLRKDGSPYFRIVKNKYEDDYKEFQLLILMKFVKIHRIIFKILSFECIIS
jgi:hypothetical protein